jgi:hypothetical protein
MDTKPVAAVAVTIDKPRLWKMDIPAFERACDGFDELGLKEFADNPLGSLKELASIAQENRFNAKTTKTLRVWIWAGLTGDDPTLKLGDFLKDQGLSALMELAVLILPALTASLIPQQAGPEEGSAVPADGGALAESVSA